MGFFGARRYGLTKDSEKSFDGKKYHFCRLELEADGAKWIHEPLSPHFVHMFILTHISVNELLEILWATSFSLLRSSMTQTLLNQSSLVKYNEKTRIYHDLKESSEK